MHPIDILELSQLMTTVQPSIQKIIGKNLVLIIGATGAGKSTFIQTCLGYEHEYRRGVRLIEDLKPEHETLKTSSSSDSCTSMI